MASNRITGRAGQAALRRRRAEHPFCEHCDARGIVRAAEEMDHIVPLALGGEDVDDNIQGLCLPCHAIKTAMENASTGGAANHPEWLLPAACKLTIVTGPPCAGKTTLVEEERGGLDMVIDLDDLAERLAPGHLPARRWTAERLNQAIRARNALLGSLSRARPGTRAWFIVSAPTLAERRWWGGKLRPTDRQHVDPGQGVCLARAAQRGTSQLDAVRQWYERAGQPWRPERKAPGRVAIGADGYPLEVK